MSSTRPVRAADSGKTRRSPPVPPWCHPRIDKGPNGAPGLDTPDKAFAADWQLVPVTGEQWSRWPDTPHWRADLNLVAADGDQVVGLCLCIVDQERMQWLGRRDGYVETLCVRPSHQRRGVGSALLLTALQALGRAGMVSATLETDEDNPTEAARFYESVGFLEIWRWAAHGRELA